MAVDQGDRDTGGISFKAFYLRRTLRIFPAYYVFVLVSIAWDWLNHQAWTGSRLAAALLYFINYHNAVTGHEGPIAHAWSLAIEEQFYLLWPVAFVLLARGGLPRVRIGLTIAIVVVAAWRSFLYLVVDTGTPYVYNAFDTRFDSLAIGCLMAAWGRSPAFLTFASSLGRNALLPLLPLACLIVSRYATSDLYHYTLGFSVDSLLVAILIIQLMQLTGTRLWSWLDSAPLRYIGLISYPIYLWHQLAIGLGNRLVEGLPGRVLLGSLLAILVATGSYYFIEKPALRLRAKWLREKPGERAAQFGAEQPAHT